MSNLTSSLTVKLIDDVSKPARTVAQALEQAQQKAKAIAKAMDGTGATSRLTGQLSKLSLSAKEIEKVAGAWKQYSSAAGLAANSANWTKTQAADVKRWETQTLSALRAVEREQKVYARSQGLQQKAAEKAAAIAAEEKASRTPRAAMGAVAGYGLGMGAAKVAGVLAVGHLAKHVGGASAARSHELTRMEASGMDPSEIGEAQVESARLAAKFPSIGQTEALHMLRNARSIVGSYHEAAEIMEPLAKLRVIAQANRPGQDVSEDFGQLVKGLEIKGVTQNPEHFRKYMEGIAKGLNVFGDTLKPYQYYEMMKYGRQATPGLSDKFILGTAPTLAQELGGSSYGNAVSGFNRAIVGGRMEHASLKELARLGLVDKRDLDYTKTGEVKGLKPGKAVKGWQVAQNDPNEWIKQFWLPALTKAGITAKESIMKETGVVFSNRMAAQLVSLLATQQSRIDKDMALLDKAPGLSAANTYQGKDPTIAWQGFKNTLEGLGGTLGKDIATSITPVMNSLSKAIGGYTERLEEAHKHREQHPDQATLGQKKFNRIMNGLFGVDDDGARGENKIKWNEAGYEKQKGELEPQAAGLEGKKAELARIQKQLDDARSGRTFGGQDTLGLPQRRDQLKAEIAAAQAAKDRLDEITSGRQKRIDAQADLQNFNRSLPRDMKKTGNAPMRVPGSLAFSTARGFGSYDPATGMPTAPAELPPWAQKPAQSAPASVPLPPRRPDELRPAAPSQEPAEAPAPEAPVARSAAPSALSGTKQAYGALPAPGSISPKLSPEQKNFQAAVQAASARTSTPKVDASQAESANLLARLRRSAWQLPVEKGRPSVWRCR